VNDALLIFSDDYHTVFAGYEQGSFYVRAL
jgi:hypothetical protein